VSVSPSFFQRHFVVARMSIYGPGIAILKSEHEKNAKQSTSKEDKKEEYNHKKIENRTKQSERQKKKGIRSLRNKP
jgi:hypothetical protein